MYLYILIVNTANRSLLRRREDVTRKFVQLIFRSILYQRSRKEAENFKDLMFCHIICVEDYNKLIQTQFLIQPPGNLTSVDKNVDCLSSPFSGCVKLAAHGTREQLAELTARVPASLASFFRVRIVFVRNWPLEALRKISIVFDIFHLARKKSQRLRMLWA